MQLDKCSVVEWKTQPMNGFDIVNTMPGGGGVLP